MHLIIKLPNSNHDIETQEDSSVETLRSLCANKLESTPENVCLVFKGKIMRDKDLLRDIGVTEGCSIHCALKKIVAPPQIPQPKITEPSKIVESSQPAPISQQNINFPGIPNLNYLESIGDTNEIARLISDPVFIDALQSENPNYRKFFETYPDIAQVLKDPASIKQMIEIIKNPTALREAIRTQEQMLNQMQNIPGGLNHYMQFMNDVNKLGELPRNISSLAAPAVQTTQKSIPDDTPAVKKDSRNIYTIEDADNPLFRDTIRVLRLTEQPDNDMTTAIAVQIRTKIASLSPRGLYGLTEFTKGLEVVREESPELMALMLNYQLATLRMNAINMDDRANISNPESVPVDTGNEETYRQQLIELASMGFTNKEENISALRHTFGDVNGAVDWILRRRGIQ